MSCYIFVNILLHTLHTLWVEFVMVSSIPSTAQDLLLDLLQLNPERRITAEDALDSKYLWSHPLPASPQELPRFKSSLEYNTKVAQERREVMKKRA
jgi:hypothetical protein